MTTPKAARTPLTLVILSPRLLFAAGVTILAAGLTVHVTRDRNTLELVASGLLGLYLIWLLVEVPVTFRRAQAAPADSRTLLPYALARLALIAAASLGPWPWDGWSPWLAVPAAAFVVGVAVRQTAIRALGRFYSHHVMRQDDHQIITGGLYRVVRHPAYAGMLLAHIGFTCFFLNVFSAMALILLVSAVTYRIRVEERTLWEVPGYAQYATGRPRLVPGVW